MSAPEAFDDEDDTAVIRDMASKVREAVVGHADELDAKTKQLLHDYLRSSSSPPPER